VLPVCRILTGGKQFRRMAWRTMEKVEVIRLWLPIRAPAVAITKHGQYMGFGIACMTSVV